jgi:scyllo-inositol 2-dehydrogenase (NADP+)
MVEYYSISDGVEDIMIQTTRPPIRIGIVGLGRAGLETHCAELDSYPHLYKIVAVCDPVKERRDQHLTRYPDCRAYRRIEDILADPDVELVDVATRSDEHVTHAMQALKTHKWVIVERPLCCDFEQAQLMRAAAIKSGNRLMVRHNYRYEPEFLLAREMLQSPLLGEIYDIKMRRGCYERNDDWQTVKRCGGGAALLHGTAFLDQALELLNTPPVKVWADFKRVASVGDAEDFFRIILRNLGGLTVDLEISGGRIATEPLFVITGTRGEFRLMPGATQGRIRYLDPAEKQDRRRSSVRTPPLNSQTPVEQFQWLEKEVPMTPRPDAGLTIIWEHVYNTIRENKPFPIPLDNAIEVLRIISLVKKESLFA